ncbi:MAG TPA: ethanolamine ammonia-lyase subunit EutB [Symbiobacteriaceae bacterium]|nr:ethanolamine ammonia-lyase subunit EutB [Symbiobacteriaceae bacterium]
MKLAVQLGTQSFQFRDLKEVMAKANEAKSGDTLAGIAAASAAERVAAKYVLSGITLSQLREHPLIPPETDAVSRVIEEQVDEAAYRSIKDWTVGEFREWLLDPRNASAIAQVRSGLTSEMVAAVTKLMSNLDLVSAAACIRVPARANTTVGLPGVLAARLQPNHPTDSVAGILAATRAGLAYGVGDAVIGVNPVTDTVQSVTQVLRGLDEFVREWAIPTQTCVLAHVTTMMRAAEQGAPFGLLFQSLAGTEPANASFGINVALLDEAYAMAQAKSNVSGPNVIYFETGQGSELSAEAHLGVDQLTLEARCYGLARRYKPFLVNTVVGFIGPEYLYDAKQVTRAGLEDHFMGKLTGLPMGVDVCYTNHMEADQNDLENLEVLLTAAGCNYFMGVAQGDDVMLSYQTSGFHDTATLRELFGLRPAPEFEAWLERMGLMAGGRLTDRAGDPTIFVR